MKTNTDSTQRNDARDGLHDDKRSHFHNMHNIILALTVALVVGAFGFATTKQYFHNREPTLEMLTYRQSRLLQQYQDDQHQINMLFPITLRDIAGFGVACIGLMMAAGGGIGGGGMLVPIYTLILGFDARHAIPLSNVTVLGGAIANTFFFNLRKRHPHTDRPLIDWDLILMMEPMTIAGALVGTKVNKLLPEFMIVLLLFVVLTLTARKTLCKAWDLHEKEKYLQVSASDDEEDDENDIELAKIPNPHLRDNKLLRRQSSAPQDSPLPMPKKSFVRKVQSFISQDTLTLEPITRGSTNQDSSSTTDDSSVPDTIMTEKESAILLNNIIESESRVPPLNVLVIVALFLLVLITNILKGGGAFNSPLGINCGSIGFWITEGLALLAVVFVTLFSRSHLLSKAKQKQRCNYKYLDGDIRWTERSTLIYPLWCGVAGFVAGLFGIGGGIVKGPIMLALGVPPAVASATSACMILFTSFTATTSFAVYGLVLPDYAMICLVLGIAATSLGQTVMSYLLRKYQRDSYIAFCIGAVVALSAVCMCLESVATLSVGGSRHVSGLCSHHYE